MSVAAKNPVASVVLALAALGVFSSGVARDPADRAVEEVKAATLAFYAALDRDDADAADRYLLPGGDSFPRSGAELDPEAPTQEESLQHLRELFVGLHANLTVRSLAVKAYGDTAVATFYTDGTLTHAGKVVSQGTFRASYVWVKTRNGWQIAHFHLSPLARP